MIANRGVEKAFQRFYKDQSIKTSVGYTGGDDSSPDYKKVCLHCDKSDRIRQRSQASMAHFRSLDHD